MGQYRGFISRYGELLFNNSAFLGDFCFQVIGLCNSTIQPVRCNASSLLFLLMRKYFQCFPEHFQRITVQITIAVSKLVGRGLSVRLFISFSYFNIPPTQLHSILSPPSCLLHSSSTLFPIPFPSLFLPFIAPLLFSLSLSFHKYCSTLVLYSIFSK